MAELAPNLFVTTLSPAGVVYLMDMDALAPCWVDTDKQPQGKGLIVNQADWDNLPPAQREMLLDTVTRESAARGLVLLQRWLSDR